MSRHDHVVRSNSRKLPGRFAYSAFSADLDLARQRKLAEVVEMTPEDMERGPSDQQFEDKFHTLAARTLDKETRDRMLDALWRLDKLDRIDGIIDLTAI